MNEFDELKQKLKEIAQLMLRLGKSLVKDAAQIIKGKIEQRQWKQLIIAGTLVIFVGGFFIGSAITRASASPGGGDGFSIIRILFGRSFPVPGKQSDGSFVIANFERDKDLKAIEVANAKIELSSQHVSQGSKSGKITLLGGEGVSAFRIEDYFESRGGAHDWSKYGAFQFYVFNPRNETERLILQIKDRREIRFKQDIHIPAAQGQLVNISIERLSGMINVRKIDQISLFRWEPKGDREFYLDDIKLVSKDAAQAAPAEKPLEIQAKDRPVKMLDYGFKARKHAWVVPLAPGQGEIVRVPFIVKNETSGVCRSCAVEGGIPFPMGELPSLEHMEIRSPQGAAVPFQARALTKWPDGSIKWAGVHFKTNLNPMDGAGFFLEYGPNVKPFDFTNGLKVDDSGDLIEVNTGLLQAKFSKKEFYLFKEILIDLNGNGSIEPTEQITKDAPLVLTFRGEEYAAHLDRKTYKIEVEEKGSQRAVIKASGWFETKGGKRFCQAIIRYYFYQGESYVKVAHTLIYTGYPANVHYYKYKEIQNRLPENEPVQQFGIRLPYSLGGPGLTAQIGQAKAGYETIPLETPLTLLQMKYEKSEFQKDGVAATAPDLHAGWIDLSSEQGGVTVGLRHFRENFPKAFRMDPAQNTIHIDLWPKEAGDLDLSTTSNAEGPEDKARGNAFGLGKTHELLFYFHPGNAAQANAADRARTFMEPLLARMNPYWIDGTGALGRLYPREDRYGTEEDVLNKLFDWAARHPRDFKWYGMLNFGDTLSWWRNEDDNWYGEYGWHPIGRWGWYNCEGVGTHTGALLQFARSGEWKYFEFGRNLARHIMDVDTVHYNTIANDPRLKNILKDEVSQVGSMHRHSGDHWSGRNEESSHTSVVGILLYHYLTGDERAFDVAKEIGEFFLKEPFTYTEHPDVAPHRAMANALWGDVLLYQATGDTRYKKAADRIIEIYLEGQQSDGSFFENYNPLDGKWTGEKHHDYMATYALGAFISYHELTQDEEVKEMLLKLVKFLGGSPDAVHGAAYSFFITGNPAYIEAVNKGVNVLLTNRQVSSDSMTDGLIYKKAIYHRPNAYLYTTPYAFEALEASQVQGGS